MDFIIRKDIYGNWWHDFNNNATKVNISDFECVIDEVANTFIIQNKNGSNVPSKAVSIADVKVIDQNISETPIAFSGAIGLKNLLTAKQYPPYRESSIVYDQKIIWRKGHAIVWNETQEFFNANFDSNGLGINLALGWGLCNGNGGRKDFRDRTVVSKGANFSTLYNTGGSANAVLIGHKHKIAKGTADFNSVSGSAPVAFGTNFTIDSESTGISENGASVPDQTGVGKNMPPYIIAQWVERVSDLIVYYTGSEGGGAVDSVNGQTGVVVIPLDYLPLAGGTMDAGADIFFDNGSALREGTYDFGANGGISRICSNQYEDMWQNGFRHVFDQSGFIRNSSNGFDLVPDETFDVTLRFKVGSFWTLDNGTTYICTDATEGAAVWEIYSVGGIPTLQQVTDEGNTTTNDIIVTGATGTDIIISSQINSSQITIEDGSAYVTLSAQNDGTEALILLGSNTGFALISPGGAQFNDDAGSSNILSDRLELSSSNPRIILTKPSGSTSIKTDLITTSNLEQQLPNASGTIALTSDITTPTLQEVLDNNHDLVDGNFFAGDTAGDNNTGTNVNALGRGAAFDNTGNAVNALGQEAAVGNIGNDVNALGFRAGVENTFNNVNLFGETAQADENGQTVLSKDGTIMARISTAELTASRKYTLQDADGTLAFLDDVTGVPYTGATQDVDLGEFGLLTGNIEFDNTPTNIPIAAGSMVWNDTDGTVDLKLKGGNVTLQIGQEQVIRVVNKTATNVNLLEANYQAVRVTGAQGQRLKVDLAQATTDVLSAETIGLVTETINNNQEGFITTSGLIRNIDTTGTLQSETWADGDVLYLSPTVAGRVTKVKPTAPNHLVIIGYVIHAHATQGSIFVKVDNGYELDELHNVKITTAANGQALTYTSATDIWENKTIIEDTIVDSVTDKAPSQNAVFDALALKQNTSTLIFDSIQKAIMRDNYFWFVPASISTGLSGYNFGLSERISGASFLYLNNGAITRGLLAFNTTIVPGILAFSRRNDALILTGLEVVFTRKIQFNSNVSGQRFFSGISKGNQFTAPTNVEPSTLTDIVGVCQLSSSTNMHVVHNDASGTATTIDLGSSYPCTDSQYNYYITIEQTTTTYIVTVERVTITTGASISTTNTLSTNIPNYATGTIQLITWISNNATAATASYLDGGAIGNIKNQ
jgi:hypothetical protein